MAIIVTGSAGFIGYHVSLALLARGERVIGVDDLNAYYDPALKRARLARLEADAGFSFAGLDVADLAALRALARRHRSEVTGVIHLAAQAGVRHSLTAPFDYVHSNLVGHMAILEVCRHDLPKLEHLVYASSSSVYGGNTKIPFAIEDRVDRPISLYAATKRANELMSHCYAHLYAIPQTGLRFFTVYGPWGRPDMAAYLFCDAIVQGRPITLNNHGEMERDFTYIDDITAGVLAALDRPPGGRGRRAACALQPRQSPAGAAAAVPRGARGGARAQGRGEARAAAAGRRGAHLRRHRGEHARPRLRAQDPDRGRPAPLRRLVPRLSRGVMVLLGGARLHQWSFLEMPIRHPSPTKLSAEDVHAMALGRVVCAWNNLHEGLSHLFSAIIEGHLSEPALAAWHSHQSDRAQRAMLKDTAKAALVTRPDLLKEIEWLLRRANSMAENRNDAIHATYALLYGCEQKETMIAHDQYGNKRSARLAGKDLIEEFQSYQANIGDLTVFCNDLFKCVVHPDSAPLPARPNV